MRIREDKIGILTTSKTFGCAIKVEAKHADLFLKEGRFDLLEEVERPNELRPISKMSVKELKGMAKDLPGYNSTLTKPKLIELIQNASSTKK